MLFRFWANAHLSPLPFQVEGAGSQILYFIIVELLPELFVYISSGGGENHNKMHSIERKGAKFKRVRIFHSE